MLTFADFCLTDDLQLKDLMKLAKLKGIHFGHYDVGPDVSQQLTYSLAYIGPCVMTIVFFLFSKQIYGVDQGWKFNQIVAAVVVFIHFFRRVIELNYIHAFTEEPRPWRSIPGIIFYYWFLFGYCVMYLFLKPGYEPFVPLNDYVTIGLGMTIIYFERLNYHNNSITADDRMPCDPNTGELFPIKECGFCIVNETNYICEGIAWSLFCFFLVQTWGSVMFFAVFVKTHDIGKKKHQKSSEKFPQYFNGKKILIPYIL